MNIFDSPSYPTYAPSGWVCPKCQRVYSPTIAVCWNCQPVEVKVTDNTNAAIDEVTR